MVEPTREREEARGELRELSEEGSEGDEEDADDDGAELDQTWEREDVCRSETRLELGRPGPEEVNEGSGDSLVEGGRQYARRRKMKYGGARYM